MMRKTLSLVVTLSLCPLAHAAERVTLSNGFSVDCAHHETIGDQVRLYTTAGSDANYLDVNAKGIASIESVPESISPGAKQSNAVSATLQPVSTQLTAEELHPMLAAAGTQHRIDEDLLASVVKAESNGRTTAVSRTGAQGLMQLMPGTAADLGVLNTFQPEQNIAGGATYLDRLLTRYHDDVTLALAAYNAGPAAVDRYHGVPPFAETRTYVRRVILEFNHRKLALLAQAK